jgi:hypothetical protein
VVDAVLLQQLESLHRRVVQGDGMPEGWDATYRPLARAFRDAGMGIPGGKVMPGGSCGMFEGDCAKAHAQISGRMGNFILEAPSQ